MEKERLGEYIKTQRLKRNLTRATFSEKLNISEGYLNNLERGNRIPSPDLMIVLDKEFGVESGFLFSLLDNADKQPKQTIELPDNFTEEDYKLIEEIIKHIERLRGLQTVIEKETEENKGSAN